MRTIVDLTRARTGTEAYILERFLLAHPPLVGNQVECYLLPSQPELSVPAGVTIAKLEEEDAANEHLIVAFLYKKIIALLSSGESVVVASFRPALKTVTESLIGRHPNRFDYLYLAPFGPPPAAVTTTPTAEWDSSFMPLDDAVGALLNTLVKLSSPPRMTDLRQVLAAFDPRFQKVVGTFTARPRFISDIVAEATKRGLVGKRDNVPGGYNNPVVEITSKGQAVATYPLSPPSSLRRQEGGVAGMVTAEATPAERSELRETSNRYIDILRRGNLGPFQEVRWAVYDQIEKSIANNPRTIMTLIRDAVAAVRENAAELLHDPEKPFPWSGVRTFIGTLVSRRSVFLNNGAPVQLSWAQIDVSVDSITENWRFALDGELVCTLLENGAEISLNDMASLAGALYNSRRDPLQDRAGSLISYLLSERRVAVSPSDPMQVCLAVEP